MSKVNNWLYVAAVSLAVASCAQESNHHNVSFNGKFEVAPSEVVVGRLNLDQEVVSDTLAVASDGTFSYSYDVQEGDPDFVYIFSEGKTLASLILESGNALSLDIDADNKVTIHGSRESARLDSLEKEHASMQELFDQFAKDLEAAVDSESEYNEILKKMNATYVDYNRRSRRYVMENIHSLTSIPVLYRQLGDLPLFAESADALLFNSVADSLLKTYPDSRYVKSFKAVADQLMNQFELANRINSAQENAIGYLDVSLPGLDGKIKKLSDLDSKVILLYFWTVSDPAQNVFNVEILKPLYEEYHDKGFDIFQVALDKDKVKWATTILGQDLPWTNVCDIKGAASPYLSLYNLYYQTEDGNVGVAIPAPFVIHNGELIDGQIVDEASFKKLLDELLN